MPGIALDTKPEAATAPRPPMGELLALLRSNGFPVTTDDYVSLLKIVEHFGGEGVDSLATRICPVIATTPEEQARFYSVFETYKKSQEVVSGVVAEPRRWPWMLVLAALLLIAIVIIREEYRGAAGKGRRPARSLLSLPPPPADTVRLAQQDYYTSDLLQAGMFAGREQDTAAVLVRWEDLGQGEIASGLRVRHRFAEPGLHLIRRSISSRSLRLGRAADTLPVYVCAAFPRVRMALPPSPVLAGEAIDFRLDSITDAAAVRAYRWQLQLASGQTVSRITDTPRLAYTFDTAGIYSVSCVPVLAGGDAGCAGGDTISVQVVDDSKRYLLSFSGDNRPVQVHTTLKWWPGLLLLLLASGIAVWGFRKGRPAPEPDNGERQPEPAPDGKRGPPYEVPFPPVQAGEIVLDKPLRRFIQQLRYKVEEECTELHVQRTIGATVRAGGLTELVFTPRRKAREYLLFIDNTAPQGMLAQLYGFIGDSMEAGGVPLLRFRYDHDFTCYNAEFPGGTALRNIADSYPAAVPIILGNGAALIDRLAPVVKAPLLQQLLRWEACLLITPVPAAAHAARERILSRHFMIATADADSLETLGQQLRSSLPPSSVNKQPAGASMALPADFATVESLKEWLGNDEPLFQWLSAICVYPKPRWELVIAVGNAILARYGRLPDLRYDVLLRLCRISWLGEGSIPQRLRMELLKELHVENELAARAVVVAQLELVDKQFKGDFLFSAERGLQDTISRFVLHASDPAGHPEHAAAAEKFRRLYKEGKVTDVPARRYLDKPEDGAWTTPLQQGGRPVSLGRYVAVLEEGALAAARHAADAYRQQRRRRKIVAAAALVFLGMLWGALFFGQAGRSSPALAALYAADPDQMVQLSYGVIRDFSGCSDSSGRFARLPGTLHVNGRPYPLRFDASRQIITAMVPYAAIEHSGGKAGMTLGAGASPARAELESLSAGGSVTVSCTDDAIGFAGGMLPEALNEIWQSRSDGLRLMNINLDQRMIYFSTSGKDRFTASRIDTVIAAKELYRVISKGDAGYSVFVISAVGPESFRLVACDRPFASLRAALSAPPECGPVDDMQLYYDHGDTGRIYLPVAAADFSFKPLVQAERSKLSGKLKRAGAGSVLNYEQYSNPDYLRSYRNYDLRKELAGYSAVFTGRINSRYLKDQSSGPFQREYVRVRFRPPVIRKAPDLSSTTSSGAPAANSIDPGARTRYPDTVGSAAERAERKDRPALSRAQEMMKAGDYDKARKLLLDLQRSGSSRIVKEANDALREISGRQNASNTLPPPQQQQQQQPPQQQQQDDDADRKQRVYDSMMKQKSARPKRK